MEAWPFHRREVLHRHPARYPIVFEPLSLFIETLDTVRESNHRLFIVDCKRNFSVCSHLVYHTTLLHIRALLDGRNETIQLHQVLTNCFDAADGLGIEKMEVPVTIGSKINLWLQPGSVALRLSSRASVRRAS